MADIGEGPGGPGAPLFWVKKEEIIEEANPGWASKIEPAPSLTSRSGSATANPLSNTEGDSHRIKYLVSTVN